jgi:quercetin dioxygenase-like cupin family protein
MKTRTPFCIGILFLFSASLLFAQDPVKVDPKHYSVVSENDRVRILKIHYGPHEKSVMHSHPDAVAVFLTDARMQFTFPDGKTEPRTGKTGDSLYTPALTHLPENTTDKEFDAILVELKGKGAKPAAKSTEKSGEKKKK